MLNSKTVAVIVPAYNEELLIGRTLSSMPSFVDKILVIDDGSKDATPDIIKDLSTKDSRIVHVRHEINRGLGQALITGYLEARNRNMDATAIMAGDNQMSPDDLEKVLRPIVEGKADYVKGNRLLHSAVIERMPTYRFIGNAGLTILTKFATGYWHSMDPQCGYTAIGVEALKRIPIETMIKGYGYNAHILYMLNICNRTVTDVEIEPIYGEEKSKIKLRTYIPTVSKLLLSLFTRRLFRKYLVQDFHPLIFLYTLGAALLIVAGAMTIRFVALYSSYGVAPTTTLTILLFSMTNALMCLIFAIWMDIEENRKLWVRLP